MEGKSKYRVVWSRPAHYSLEKIAHFIESNFSKVVADKSMRAILTRVQLLADFPYSGRIDYNHSSPNTVVRYVVKDKSKIYYLIEDDIVQIIGVIDTRQNPPLI